MTFPKESQVAPRIIPLASAPGAGIAWGKPQFYVYLWAVAERLFVTNSWQPSSALRTAVLRFFGAKIGDGVVFRPRTRVAFPWKLTVGDSAWIGEGVWIHNQDFVTIGRDAVVSQECFITTGSHAHRTDMALITRPVTVDPGAWLTSRCIVLGGSRIGTSAIVGPGSVVRGDVPSNTIWAGNPIVYQGTRFNAGTVEDALK